MRRLFLGFISLISIIALTGCANLLQPTAQVDVTAGAAPLPPYFGPKARIALAEFDVKAAKATGEIGSGLREMLVTALIQSNRFNVVERQVLEAVMKEQELSASGAVQSGAEVARGQLKAADLIITAAVTEFEPSAMGGGAGAGASGSTGGGGILGAILGASMNRSHMALDIRIIDTATSEILAATRVQGQANDIAGGLMAGFFGSWSLSGGLSGYANTPTEKAIRICIIEAVRYISSSIPPQYYKY
jgi:curli biogenesis system outer membrane secretion channel CsgG